MKNQKIISFLIFIFISNLSMNGQIVVDDKNENCYWFNIGVNLAVNQHFKNLETNVYRVYKGISSGSFNKFEETFYKKLKKNILCVGPFESEQLARFSHEFYENLRLKTPVADEEIYKMAESGNEFYYYLTSPENSSENKQLRFERFPSAIADGNIRNFNELLIESITHQKLAIGPFSNYISAEKSKFIIRKYGEQDSKNQTKEIKVDDDLKKMAENWKSLKLELSANGFEEKGMIQCNLNINFPAEYFGENALMVLSFGFLYNDTIFNFQDGVTIQGTKFYDNNRNYISYAYGGNANYAAWIPYFDWENTKFVVKGTLINNKDMMDCETVFLNVKLQ
jgi:hypothetical protein